MAAELECGEPTRKDLLKAHRSAPRNRTGSDQIYPGSAIDDVKYAVQVARTRFARFIAQLAEMGGITACVRVGFCCVAPRPQPWESRPPRAVRRTLFIPMMRSGGWLRRHAPAGRIAASQWRPALIRRGTARPISLERPARRLVAHLRPHQLLLQRPHLLQRPPLLQRPHLLQRLLQRLLLRRRRRRRRQIARQWR